MDVTLPAAELQSLFDALPEVVFFIKDEQARFTHCNRTLVRRLGRKTRADVLGKTSADLFPAPLGASYLAQDRRVLAGDGVDNLLELHLFPNRRPGWCLTIKRPIYQEQQLTGLIGISRDLARPTERPSSLGHLGTVLEHMQAHLPQPLRVKELATIAQVSVAQLERHFRHVFQVTPQQMLTRLRIEEAMQLLQGQETVADIGLRCGFSDQSAFTRQFKATVGMTPRDYRAHIRGPEVGRA